MMSSTPPRRTKIKTKIVILCPFSYPSICGVWTRAYNDAKYLIKKGYEVHIFSSNIIKGTREISTDYELYEGIHIHRFKPFMSWGENTNFWLFGKELKNINPDIIHSHIYRHPATNISAYLAKKYKKPFVLTTHAPFVDKSLRSSLLNLAVSFHDKILSKVFFPLCSKVIAITNWEISFLKELKVKPEQLTIIPNPIAEEFFKAKSKIRKTANPSNKNKTTKILFLGRISRIKNIGSLILAGKILKEKGIRFQINIVGPSEEEYSKELVELIDKLKLEEEIKISPQVSDIGEKIKAYKDNDIFVLPSFREAMPTALIEAASLGLTIISSKTEGGKEVILGQNKPLGYLSEIDDETELANRIIDASKNRIDASKEMRKYELKTIGAKLDNVYKSVLK